MKINLNNYTTPPDPEVWDRIERTLKRHTLRRRITYAAAGLFLVAAIATAIVTLTPTDTAEAPVVAQLDSQYTPEAITPAIAPEPATEPTTVSAVQKQAATAPLADLSAETNLVPESKTAIEPPAATPVSHIAATPAARPMSIPAAHYAETAEAETTAITVADNSGEPKPAEPEWDNTIQNSTQTAAKSTSSSPYDDTILWIPNIFAPGSGDPSISTFKVKSNQPKEYFTDYRIIIFSRSGQQVYISHNMEEGWDGTFKGRELPQSTYVYVIQYTDSQKFKHQRKGTVTLLR